MINLCSTHHVLKRGRYLHKYLRYCRLLAYLSGILCQGLQSYRFFIKGIVELKAFTEENLVREKEQIMFYFTKKHEIFTWTI